MSLNDRLERININIRKVSKVYLSLDIYFIEGIKKLTYGQEGHTEGSIIMTCIN